MKYICNKANSPICFKCDHSEPHEKIEDNLTACTKYGECTDENLNVIYRVKCISVESKTGKKILKDIEGYNKDD